MVRRCGQCGIEKSIDNFHKNASRKDGLQTWCKDCQRERTYTWRQANPEKYAAVRKDSYERRGRDTQRARLYGLQPGEYETLLELQDGKCAICEVSASERPLDVDHDHQTRRVRGLLCRLCNTAIGKLNDDPALLLKAVKYLEP